MSKISEFFGLNCKDESLDFEAAMNTQICPYTQRVCTKMRKSGAVDKVTFILVWANKKDAHWRHPAYFIILFRFNAVADKRQWSSAASKPRRKTRAKLCSRFCAENEPSHQTCRSFSASR